MNENNTVDGVDIGMISSELLDFYDKFSEFNEYCAFFCDSFSCLASKNELVEINTAHGVALFSDWMKSRAQLLKAELNSIRQELHKVATAAKLHPVK